MDQLLFLVPRAKFYVGKLKHPLCLKACVQKRLLTTYEHLLWNQWYHARIWALVESIKEFYQVKVAINARDL